MYQANSCGVTAGVCAEQDRVDPLISQEPSSLPVELDYSGFDIVKATQYGAIGRVKELADAGWDVNQPDSETVTLLHWAAINNRRDIIAFLLERGAMADAIGGELNATPLHWATRQGHLGACVQLMQVCYNVEVNNNKLNEYLLLGWRRSKLERQRRVLLYPHSGSVRAHCNLRLLHRKGNQSRPSRS